MRVYKYIILLVLFPLITFQAKYDKFVITSGWPGDFCNYINCTIDQNWTNTTWVLDAILVAEGRIPVSQCKSDIKYEFSLINETVREMINSYWVLAPLAESFAWKFTGTCWNDPDKNASDVQIINDFFATAVNIFLKIDFYSDLSSVGIVPRDEPYTFTEFKGAFDTLYGANMTYLNCLGLNGKVYLDDVTYCVNTTTGLMIPCLTNYVNEKCNTSENIYYQPFVNDTAIENLLELEY